MEQIDNLDNNGIDLKEILTIVRRRYMLIVAITLVALITSGIYSYYFTVPVYQADTVLLVTQASPENQNISKGEGMENLINSIAKLPEMTINTYVSQLQGEAVMERVIRKLQLDKTGYTTKSLARLVSVEAEKDNNLIKLTVSHLDPYLAAKIANTMTQEFLNFLSQTNEQQMNKSMELLKKQAASTGEELKKAVANLNNLEAQPRGVAMLDKLIAVKTEDLSKYQSQILQTNMEYQQVLAGKHQAEHQLKETPQIIETSEFDEHLGKSILVEEVNPAYTELTLMINEKSIIASEKEVEVKSLQMMISQLNQELKSLQFELGQKKNILQITQNEAKRLEETNTMLRTKIDEANLSRSIMFGEKHLTVISPATVPVQPVGANKVKTMAVALVFGLAMAIGLAFILNYFDHTVKTPKDVEEILGLPVLGQIPIYNPKKLEAIWR